MGILSGVLLVVFIIVAVLLILLVLVQNEEGDTLGGVFASGSASVFGSRSGNVLTRATSILGGLFLVLSFGLALMNRTPGTSGVESAARELSTDVSRDWWREDTSASAETPSVGTIETPPVSTVPSVTEPTENVEPEPLSAEETGE
ncbi:MAG: preprotein translocase subunit SecG [Treponema sp.]|jgi:preprotein translocase subunit SecG|nr:preprotein translocase subunit SecG [Treponema sp.]